MICRVETCSNLIRICHIYTLFEIVSFENGNKSIFTSWLYPWCVLLGCVALIRDNGMLCKPFIRTSLLMQNFGGCNLIARAKAVWDFGSVVGVNGSQLETLVVFITVSSSSTSSYQQW